MATIKTDSKRPTFTSDFVKHDTEHAVFLGHPVVDDLVTAVIAMGAETWSNRRRTWITELLLEKHGKVTREMIETYVPSAGEEKQMASHRDEMVHRLFGHMTRAGDDVVASQSIKPFSKK
jgi:hypothetical protein